MSFDLPCSAHRLSLPELCCALLTNISELAPLSLSLIFHFRPRHLLKTSTRVVNIFVTTLLFSLMPCSSRQHLSPVINILTTTLLSLGGTALLPQVLALINNVAKPTKPPLIKRHLNLGCQPLHNPSSYSGCHRFGLQTPLS